MNINNSNARTPIPHGQGPTRSRTGMCQFNATGDTCRCFAMTCRPWHYVRMQGTRLTVSLRNRLLNFLVFSTWNQPAWRNYTSLDIVTTLNYMLAIARSYMRTSNDTAHTQLGRGGAYRKQAIATVTIIRTTNCYIYIFSFLYPYIDIWTRVHRIHTYMQKWKK